MPSFQVINTALTGLVANQRALEVTSHNVANVSTDGYHRQVVQLAATTINGEASNLGGFTSALGNGVDVVTVRRMQDVFLQQQTRQSMAQSGRWGSATATLTQLESALSPATDLNLSSMLDNFFNSWQLLANTPEDQVGRLSVRAAGENLARFINSTVDDLNAIIRDVDTNLQSRINEVNNLTESIAKQNIIIVNGNTQGMPVNDILDQRDQAMMELTKLTGATSYTTDDGAAYIGIDGKMLVQGTVPNRIKLVADSSGAKVVWTDDNTTLKTTTGEIGGLLESRNSIIPTFQSQLDNIAFTLSNSINNLHRQGVTLAGETAVDFFSGNTAADIRVSDAIEADVNKITTTRIPGATGDGSLATEISDLYRQPLIGSSTLNQAARAIIGQVGTALQNAKTNADASTALTKQLLTQEKSASGVSLDEELTNMLLYQRSYDASAKVLQTADEMLKTLLDRIG
jgi:flagellar hook-associated protein 1 FlgK